MPKAADQISLTPLEVDVMRGLYLSEYHDGGTAPYVWSWSIEAKVASKAQIPGVVASLAKKGLVICDLDNVKPIDRAISVTDLGVAVAVLHKIVDANGTVLHA